MKWLFALLFITPLMLQAQSATFKEIRVPSTKFGNDNDTTITYPLVVLQDNKIAKRINKAIKARLLDENTDDSTLDTETALKQYAHDNLREMSYTLLFNKNGLLSIEVELAATGFYDYGFKRHFLFDLSNGKLLTLADIILPAKYEWFKKTMLQRKKNEMEKYTRRLRLDLDSGFVDKDTYDACLERINDNHCKDKIYLDEFSLAPGPIEIFDGCFFPHTMMGVAPFYHILYNLNADGDILEPAIAGKLFGR